MQGKYGALILLLVSMLYLLPGQVETDETENGNGKLKQKTETERGNGKLKFGNGRQIFKHYNYNHSTPTGIL